MKPIIKTDYINPPIPFRGCDWIAYIDGNEEGPQGFGETEQKAIEKLQEALDES